MDKKEQIIHELRATVHTAAKLEALMDRVERKAETLEQKQHDLQQELCKWKKDPSMI